MKRFFLVTTLIAILSMSSFFITKTLYDKEVFHVKEEMWGQRSHYYEFVSGKPQAIVWAFGVFAALMTVNILYELYIVPKKKKQSENKY